MTVLLGFATEKQALIMSDSRGSYFKMNDPTRTILKYEENTKKLYQITNKFILGTAGYGSIGKWIEDVKPCNPNSVFYNLKDNTYEKWLDFFLKRFQISDTLKKEYSAILSIGIDSNSHIRMDGFTTLNLSPTTAIPQRNEFFSKIFLPPDIPNNYEDKFSSTLQLTNHKIEYCEWVIKNIASKSKSVNNIIQKYEITM